MKAKQMKVYKGSTKDYTPVPRITLQGQWLKELGFSIGDSLTVSCGQGQLIILNHAYSHAARETGMVAGPAVKYEGKGGYENGSNNLLCM